MSSRLEVVQELVKAIKCFSVHDPVHYRRLREDVLRYIRLLDAFGLEHSQVKRRYPIGPVLRYMLPRVVVAALGFPFFCTVGSTTSCRTKHLAGSPVWLPSTL